MVCPLLPSSSSDISRINGSTAANKAALASGWRTKGEIFAINYKGKQHYPVFQFDNEGKPRKVMADVIKLFDEENKGWQLALWFANPNAVLHGKMPVEISINGVRMGSDSIDILNG